MSLPGTYACPEQMARALATYLPCPQRIRFEVLCNFQSAPRVESIARFREEYLAERAAPKVRDAFKPHEGYYPDDVSRHAETANKRFVAKLLEARA